MRQRLLNFGHSTIAIEYGEGRPAELVHFLFKDIPDGDEPPWTCFRLEDLGQEDGLRLWRDEKLVSQTMTTGGMAEHLMGQACFTLAYESRGGLLLHAAAVSASGLGIIMPGKSGAGKSTLAAWLAGRGTGYGSDEMVFVPNGRMTFSAFRRPITIKRQARHLLPALLRSGASAAFHLVQEPVTMVPPEYFGDGIVPDDQSLDLIVFPRYQEGVEMEAAPISKALAVFELMKCLANARNLSEHGLPEVTRLADRVPAYLLRFSDLERAGQTVVELASRVE